MSGSPFGILEYQSGQDQIDASQDAIAALMEFGQQQLDWQKYQWEQTRADFQPYMDLGYEGIGQLRDVMPRLIDTTLQPYSQAFRNFQLSQRQIDPRTGLVTSPELSTETGFEFDPEDPVFKSKLDILNKQVDANLAKQGLLNSSAGMTIRDRAIQGLVNEEVDKQYSRNIAERAAQNQIAKEQYALDTDVGNRLYGRYVDERGRLMTDDDRMLNLMNRRYGIDRDLFSTRYGAATDWTKIGQGAAGTAGQIAQPYAMGYSNTLGNMGQNVASANMYQGAMRGQMMRNMGNNMGNTFGNIMSMINNMRAPQGGGGGGYSGGYGGGGGGYGPYSGPEGYNGAYSYEAPPG